MSDETKKSQQFRLLRGDFKNFLHGKGIDIGSGPDPLQIEVGTVRPWDKEDGDAQLMAGVADGEFDFVYSSHCLEHMQDVRETLSNWVRILRPGGHLYFTVPDYILYEKMTWPSLFNFDHKQSFSIVIPRAAVQRPNHFHITQDLVPILKELNIDVLRYGLEDFFFNYNAGALDQTTRYAVCQICIIGMKK
jgi:SAM-dependent methyltransferase